MKHIEKIIYAVYLIGFSLSFLKGIVGVIGLFIISLNTICHLVLADSMYNKEKQSKLTLFSYLFAYVYTYNIIIAMFYLRGWGFNALLLVCLIITFIAIIFPFNMIIKNVNGSENFFKNAKIRTYIFFQFQVFFVIFFFQHNNL